MSHVLNTEKLTKVLFDFSFENKIVQFSFDERRTISLPLSNKQMCLYLLIILFTTYKKGVALERATKKKSGVKMDVEKVFCSIYKKVKENSEGELYDGKGRLSTDISRIAQKMKAIPSTYQVITKGNRAIVNFPCQDIVYIKFNKNQRLLSDEIEKIKGNDCKMKIEDVFCEVFR